MPRIECQKIYLQYTSIYFQMRCQKLWQNNVTVGITRKVLSISLSLSDNNFKQSLLSPHLGSLRMQIEFEGSIVGTVPLLREDMFGRSSFWIVGGDGWAYDIGYGGLDHVIASEEHVNILVLDTEMYSNTGGQASKATPKGAMAKFAEGGKLTQKKDMGQLAMTYKNVYVASICVHVNPQQAVRAMIEADAYPGPSIILAYSPCISQGFPMAESIARWQWTAATGLFTDTTQSWQHMATIRSSSIAARSRAICSSSLPRTWLKGMMSVGESRSHCSNLLSICHMHATTGSSEFSLSQASKNVFSWSPLGVPGWKP